MPSFKNIEQLKAEKKRLRNSNKNLEQQINQDWHDFKYSLRPVNILNQVVNKTIEKHKEKNATVQLIADNVVNLASKATTVLTQKLEQKLDKWLNK
jgi:cell division septum initiation protein DivIVA